MNDRRNITQPDDDVRDLLGAYVLDAVDDVERRRVERAAAEDVEIAAEIARLRVAVDALADTADDAPPPRVWDSIVASIDEGVSADVTPITRVTSRRTNGPRIMFLAAASIAVVVVLAGAALVGRNSANRPTDSVAAMTAMANDAAKQPGSRSGVLTDPGNTMEVRVVADAQGHGFVMAGALPALPDGETYQLWSAVDGTMVSLGMIGSNPQMALVSIDPSVTELALTREPVVGSVVPTSNPMATGKLA